MTTMSYPRVYQKEGSLKVEFGPESREAKRQPLRMVLDFGAFGDIVGIEILNLMMKVGKRALETISQVVSTTGEEVRYAYDEESDSFSLCLKPGRSLDQKSVDGSATCDDEGRITALISELESP